MVFLTVRYFDHNSELKCCRPRSQCYCSTLTWFNQHSLISQVHKKKGKMYDVDTFCFFTKCLSASDVVFVRVGLNRAIHLVLRISTPEALKLQRETFKKNQVLTSSLHQRSCMSFGLDEAMEKLL